MNNLKFFLFQAKVSITKLHFTDLIISDHEFYGKKQELFYHQIKINISNYANALLQFQQYSSQSVLKSINLKQNNLQQNYACIQILFTDRRYKECLDLMKQISQRNKFNSINHYIIKYNLAWLYHELGDLTKAIFYLEQSLKQKTNFQDGIQKYCKMLYLSNRGEQCIGFLLKLIQGNNQLQYSQILQILYLQFADKCGIEIQQILKKLNKRYLKPKAYFNLALLLKKKGYFELSLKLWQKLINKIQQHCKLCSCIQCINKCISLLMLCRINLADLCENNFESNVYKSKALFIYYQLKKMMNNQENIAKVNQRIIKIQFNVKYIQQQDKKNLKQSHTIRKKQQSENKIQSNNSKLYDLLLKKKQLKKYFSDLITYKGIKQMNNDSQKKLQSLSNTLSTLKKQGIEKLIKNKAGYSLSNTRQIKQLELQFENYGKKKQQNYSLKQLDEIVSKIIKNMDEYQQVNAVKNHSANKTDFRVKKKQKIVKEIKSKQGLNYVISQTNRCQKERKINKIKQFKNKEHSSEIMLNKKYCTKQLKIQFKGEKIKTDAKNDFNLLNIKKVIQKKQCINDGMQDKTICLSAEQLQNDEKQSNKENFLNIPGMKKLIKFEQIVKPQFICGEFNIVNKEQKNIEQKEKELELVKQQENQSEQFKIKKSLKLNQLNKSIQIQNNLHQQQQEKQKQQNLESKFNQQNENQFYDSKQIIEQNTNLNQDKEKQNYQYLKKKEQQNYLQKQQQKNSIKIKQKIKQVQFKQKHNNDKQEEEEKEEQKNNLELKKKNEKKYKNDLNNSITKQLSIKQITKRNIFIRELEKGEILQKDNKIIQAYKHYLKMYKIYKLSSQKQKLLIHIGKNFQLQGKYQSAQKTYLKCTKFNNVQAFLKLGNLTINNGRIKCGIENLQKASCICRNDLQIQMKLVYAYSLLDETMNRALALATTILKRQPESFKTLIMTANILQKQGKIKQALEITKAIDHQKSTYSIKYYIGILHLQDSNISQAFLSFKESLQLNPNHIPSLIEVATILSDLKPNESIKIFQSVLSVQPLNRLALNRLGKIYEFNQNNYAQAIKMYRKTLENQPNYEAYVKIGDCLQKQFCYIEALINYQFALNLNKNSTIYTKIATIHYKKKQYKKALQNYYFAIDLLPKINSSFEQRKFLLLQIGKISIRLQQWDKSISVLKQLLNFEQNDLNYKLIGQAYYGKIQYQQALKYFEKAHKLSNYKSIQIMQRIAACFDKQQQYLASKSIYENIITIDPNNYRCINNLANILLIIGNTLEAFSWFEILLDKKPNNLERRLKVSEIYATVGDWNKVQHHLMICLRQKDNNIQVIQRLIKMYKEKRQNKLVIKWQKKLALIKNKMKN